MGEFLPALEHGVTAEQLDDLRGLVYWILKNAEEAAEEAQKRLDESEVVRTRDFARMRARQTKNEHDGLVALIASIEANGG